jgi:hypothetical protein
LILFDGKVLIIIAVVTIFVLISACGGSGEDSSQGNACCSSSNDLRIIFLMFIMMPTSVMMPISVMTVTDFELSPTAMVDPDPSPAGAPRPAALAACMTELISQAYMFILYIVNPAKFAVIAIGFTANCSSSESRLYRKHQRKYQ